MKGTELVGKTLNTFGNLYFMRSVGKSYRWWTIKSEHGSGAQVLELIGSYEKAAVWSWENGNNFLDSNELRGEFKLVKVSDVTGHDGSSN